MSEIDELNAKMEAKEHGGTTITRRAVLGVAGGLGAMLSYLGFRKYRDSEWGDLDPAKCPYCSHAKLVSYPVGVLDIVKAEGNNFTVNPDIKQLIMLRICVRCHVVSESWVKKS